VNNSYIVTIGVLIGLFAFAWMPESMWNWNYDYFQFMPAGSIVVILACVVAVAFALPKLVESAPVRPFMSRWWVRITVMVAMVVAVGACFWIFRTRIHLFDGDAATGSIPTNLSVSYKDFLPPLPYYGRIDTWGLGATIKLLVRSGWLDNVVGGTSMIATQVYCVIVGVVDILVAAWLLRRRMWILAIVLTCPFMHNLFGNADSYPIPVGVGIAFFAFSIRMFELQKPTLIQLLAYGLFWLFSGYAHPCFGFAGFLPALLVARWYNNFDLKFKLPEKAVMASFAAVMIACVLIYYKKTWFSRSLDQNEPIVSLATLRHFFNMAVLPVFPLAVFALKGPAPRKAKLNCLFILFLQFLCFAPGTFRQGANDVFAYMMFTMGVLAPWIVLVARYPLSRRALCGMLAVQLLVIMPLVSVHSSPVGTIARAKTLYPIDQCVHNTIMSWQTHLGLKIGDNLLDCPELRKASYQVLMDGARNAQPEGFRGGNYLFYVAFHYQWGDFAEGKRLLSDFLRNNPKLVGHFLTVRPGFIYLNRSKLWDDLLEVYPDRRAHAQLERIVAGLKEKARVERYCLKPPSYVHYE